MAIQKLVLCLAPLFVLYASPAYCAPQSFVNFGWPTQQDYTLHLPGQAFTPTETVPDRAQAMPGLWSLPVTPVAASANRQTTMVDQSRKLHKQPSLSEFRLLKGAANRLANEETLTSGEQITSDRPVADDKTDLRKPVNAVEPVAVEESKVQRPKGAPKVTLVKEEDEQRLMEFIPAGVAAFGAFLGREGCRLKAACLAGTLVPSSLQGRDMMLLAAETLVPAEWKELFQAAKSSMIQKQDCSSFPCF